MTVAAMAIAAFNATHDLSIVAPLVLVYLAPCEGCLAGGSRTAPTAPSKIHNHAMQFPAGRNRAGN
jgi:hypothetical protein